MKSNKKRSWLVAQPLGGQRKGQGAAQRGDHGGGGGAACAIPIGGQENWTLVGTSIHPGLTVGLVLDETEDRLDNVGGRNLRTLFQMMQDTRLEALQIHTVGR